MPRPLHDPERAFTRVDALAVIACAGLLAAAVLPVLSAPSPSRVAVCLNNLRLIGRATQMWSAEHQDEFSWRVSTSEGGTRFDPGGKPPNAWYEFSRLSNELVTPRILACPADAQTIGVDNFSDYISSVFRSRSTSYFINLHAASELPRSPLSGDPNLRLDPPSANCGLAKIFPVFSISFPSSQNLAWTNAVHGEQGNLVFVDGSVAETTSEQLRSAFKSSQDENGTSAHLLKAH
jgi:prepilin-type processing-associated H-X9-DG protein